MTATLFVVLMATLLPLLGSQLPHPLARRWAWGLSLAACLALAGAWLWQPGWFTSDQLSLLWWRSGDLEAQLGLELRPERVGWLCLAMGLVLMPGPDDRLGTWKGLWLIGTALILLGSTLPTSLAGYLLSGWAMIGSGVASPHWRWLALGDAAMVMALLGVQRALGTGFWHELAKAPGVQDWLRMGWPALLLLAAVAVRSAQFPCHAWLLTGEKTLAWLPLWPLPLFGLLFRLFPVWGQHPQLAVTMAALGGLGALIGGLVALFQREPAKLVAWLAVAQVGWLLLALGAGEGGTVQVALGVTLVALVPLTVGIQRGASVFVLAGAVALTGLPFVSGLFWSQGVLVDHLWQHGYGAWLGLAIAVQALLTAAAARLCWMVGGGEIQETPLSGPDRAVLIGVLVVWLGGLPLAFSMQGEAIGGLPVWPCLLVVGVWAVAWFGVSAWAWKGWPQPRWWSRWETLAELVAEAGHVERFYDAVAETGARRWAAWGRRVEQCWEALEAGTAVGTVLVGEGFRRLQGWQVSSYVGVLLLALVVALWITR